MMSWATRSVRSSCRLDSADGPDGATGRDEGEEEDAEVDRSGGSPAREPSTATVLRKSSSSESESLRGSIERGWAAR